jgi:hypothetical protein
LVGAIRAAAARLGLDEEARRDVQERVAGKRSTTGMTLAELGRVLDELNKGWKGPMGHRAHLGKIRALWWTLFWLGEVRCAEGQVEKTLDAFVQRQAKVAALRFVDHRAAAAVIEALKDWAARAGVKWPAVGAGAEYPGDPRDAATRDRHAVLDAIWLKLREAGAVRACHYEDYFSRALGLTRSHHHWSAREYDAAIRLAGKTLRRAARLGGRGNGEAAGDDDA